MYLPLGSVVPVLNPDTLIISPSDNPCAVVKFKTKWLEDIEALLIVFSVALPMFKYPSESTTPVNVVTPSANIVYVSPSA